MRIVKEQNTFRLLSTLALASLLLAACESKKTETAKTSSSPVVSKDGNQIQIKNKESISFFKTQPVSSSLITADMIAPAQVVAISVGNKVILFNNPELTSSYTELLNHQSAIIEKQAVVKQKQAIIGQKESIIKQKQIEIDRFEDLAKHGAATGKDVADARTEKLIAESEKSIAQSEKSTADAELIGEQSLIIQHYTSLKAAGFDPDMLVHYSAGKAWVIADISENQINKLRKGNRCSIKFTAYPNETFSGTIDGIADVMDNVTRMTKVRILLNNIGNKFHSGMFALVSFGVSEGNFISIDKNSLITVQGKNYVFVKKGADTFERKEVQTGEQIGDKVIIFSGINNGDEVVVSGAIQMKGLSFGY